jgi:hypothetical protein
MLSQKVYENELARLKRRLKEEQDKMNGNEIHDADPVMMARMFSNEIQSLEQLWYEQNHPEYSKDGEPAEPIY